MKNSLTLSYPAGEWPLVTIIVPTIGRPDYIIDTIRSIVAQTYSNLQILISDNAPTAATAPLLAAAGISDIRFEFVTRPVRLGFSSHMNACIVDARGTYMMILSDDDQITPGYVEEMVHMMHSRPELAVCLGRQVKITEHDHGVLPDRVSDMRQSFFNGLEYLRDSLSGDLQTGVLTHISMFTRKADMLKVGGFNDYPDGSHVDNVVIFKLALRGDVGLAKSLMYYRVYISSVGLSTPFSSLISATRTYTRDCARLLRAELIVAERDKVSILQSLKSNNVWLLLSRIRHVYRHRLSAIALVSCLLQVGQFKLTRMENI